MEERFTIVCLSSQDWHVDLPTNRQQVMSRAAARGHEVLFIETGHFLGRHVWSFLRRGPRRSLGLRLISMEEVASGIRSRKAVNLLPWGHKHQLANRINCALTARLLRRLVRGLPGPVVLWIYDPCAARMAGVCGEALTVYDCVDDYVEQAGSNRRRRALAAAGDERAAKRSHVVFATTRPLYERHRLGNSRTHLVPNAGDYEHFIAASERSFAAPAVKDLRRPVLGFVGNLVPSKVDFALLESVALARPEWTLLLVGPARSSSRRELGPLAELANVHWVGAKPYAEVPRYVAAFDVGLIPYVANAYTRSCFPLKVYEYLAAGKPIVASGLPQLAGMEPDVVVTDGAREFVPAVEAALARLGRQERERRIELAAQHTWETRTERLLALVAAEVRT